MAEPDVRPPGAASPSGKSIFKWTEVHKLFFIQRGSGCRFSRTFTIFDILIRSGDIRDQSRKLSKIAQNFGRFFCRNKFWGADIVKIVPILSPLFHGTSTEKV